MNKNILRELKAGRLVIVIGNDLSLVRLKKKTL